MSRWKRAGGTLAMHTQAATLALHSVVLDLGDVVSDVPHDVQSQPVGVRLDDPGDTSSKVMRDHLAIGECVVRCSGHGPQVVLPFCGRYRGAYQLLVRQPNPVLAGGLHQRIDGFRAYLIPESPRPRVDGEHKLVHLQPEDLCCILVVHLGDESDFHEVIPRSQCPKLVSSPLEGPGRDDGVIRPGNGPFILGAHQVLRSSIPPTNGP